ncbi:3-hydroxyacyl-CoA dehydrogenase family protein [Chloroflexota bacterium]
MAEIKKILMVGAGTMGHGMAQVFSQGGYDVTMFSRTQETLDKAYTMMKSSLDTMVEAGYEDKKRIPGILERIKSTRSLEEGAADADLAIETVVEEVQAKKDIFTRLDAVCPPKALIASNSSFINIFDITDIRPDRLMMVHFYTPAEIIPLVDVVKGPQTSEDNIKAVMDILMKIGKKPVLFNKPIAGYVVSRLMIAYQRELYFLLDQGYLTAQDLDEAVIWGLALRMMVIGGLQRVDFGGLGLSYRSLGRAATQCTPLDYQPKKLKELVEQGFDGVKTGKGFYDYKGRSQIELAHDRDVKLLKLLKVVKEMDLAGPVL